MKIINVGNIVDNIEDFILAKIDIDKFRIESKEISEKTSLQEFIQYVQNNLIIYINGNDSISFKYITTDNKTYLFYIYQNDIEAQQYINNIIDVYNNTKFNINDLHLLTTTEMSKFNVETMQYYIINNKYYIYK